MSIHRADLFIVLGIVFAYAGTVHSAAIVEGSGPFTYTFNAGNDVAMPTPRLAVPPSISRASAAETLRITPRPAVGVPAT